MIQEIKDQLPSSQKPGCVVASVGGGGLLTGKFPGKNDSQVGSSPLASTLKTLDGQLYLICDTPKNKRGLAKIGQPLRESSVLPR